jgi:hypothetical protein
VLPFVLCLSTPRRWDYFLVIPILLGAVNSGGVAYISFMSAESMKRSIDETFSSHRGEYVLLEKTIFRVDGIFDRYGIKQRFANQGETNLQNLNFFGKYPERYIPGRFPLGSNFAFEADIPYLPALPVVFGDERSVPYIRMSEGIGVIFDDPSPLSPNSAPVFKGFTNYSGKIKFFTRVMKNPADDVEFKLTASLNIEEGFAKPQRMFVYANNLRIGEWIWNRPDPEEKTVTIPLITLKESHDSPMSLLVMTFDLFDAETNTVKKHSLMFERMEFRLSRVR